MADVDSAGWRLFEVLADPAPALLTKEPVCDVGCCWSTEDPSLLWIASPDGTTPRPMFELLLPGASTGSPMVVVAEDYRPDVLLL